MISHRRALPMWDYYDPSDDYYPHKKIPYNVNNYTRNNLNYIRSLNPYYGNYYEPHNTFVNFLI